MRAISMLGMVLILMGSMLGSPVAAEESEVEAVEIRQARFTALTLESFGNTSLAKKLRVLLDKKDVGSIRQWLKKHQDAVRAANLAFFDASSASDRVKIKKQEDAIRDELVKRVEKIERIEKKRQADGRKRERDDKGRWRDDKGWGAQEREEDDRRRGRGWRENSDDEDDRKVVQDPDSKKQYPKFDQKFWSEMFSNPWDDKNREVWKRLRNSSNRNSIFKKRGKPDGFDDKLEQNRKRGWGGPGGGRR